MKKQHILTILASLSDRADEIKKKINHANRNLKAGRDPEIWLNDREYWEDQMKEVEEAREAISTLPDDCNGIRRRVWIL